MKSILMKLFIIGVCVSFFPIQAIAEGWTGWHQIDKLYQRECKPNRGLEVRLQTRHDNPDTCSNRRVLDLPCDIDSAHLGQRLNFPQKANLFNMAFTEDFYIRAYVNGCDNNGQAVVSAVMVSKDNPDEQ